MKNLAEYGLKEIPFKSLATDTGQYPFVPSSSFNELITEISTMRAAKDPSAIIIQGPQGSGKTATKNGIKNKFKAEKDVIILHITLTSVDLADLTFAIIEDAKEQKLIDDEFLQKISYSPTDIKQYTNPDLIKKIIQTIEEVLKEHYLYLKKWRTEFYLSVKITVMLVYLKL